MVIRMFDFDICFLSILYPENSTQYEKYVKKHRSQNITSIQTDLISGIDKANQTSPFIINTLLVPLYPKGYRKPVIKESDMLINGIPGGGKTIGILMFLLYTPRLFFTEPKSILKNGR